MAPFADLARSRFDGRRPDDPERELWRSATPDALHTVRSSRRGRWPVMAAAAAVLVWVGFAQQVDFTNPTERHLERGQLKCRCSER
jgi:hypothetical protein